VVDHVAVAVRSFDDLDALAHVRWEAGGVARDHAYRLAAALEDVVEDLVADQASGSCDDDHETSKEDRSGEWGSETFSRNATCVAHAGRRMP
jgi:hypothetical protein